MPADQRDDHQIRPWRGLREREQRAELTGWHPVMDVHDLTLHLRKNRIAATERQQRKLAENNRKRNERIVHRALRDAIKMLSGVSTSMVGRSGNRKTAIATKPSAAISAASGLLRKGSTILTAIEINRPAAAAARPANR